MVHKENAIMMLKAILSQVEQGEIEIVYMSLEHDTKPDGVREFEGRLYQERRLTGYGHLRAEYKRLSKPEQEAYPPGSTNAG